ncbi:UNVERIFIED_CONTAM: hypothetical protein FKN15_023505 [Acipenser sinensis]
MPQSFSPCREWDYESEPLLFDEEFCQNLMKDLEMIPTPPQSPPTKPGFAESLSSLFPSNLDQLEFVSEMLFEDQDFIHQDFYWGSDFNSSSSSLSQGSSNTSKNQQPVVLADCLWSSDAGKSAHEKLSAVLSSSPLLSDIDTNIFQDIAATTLDCHNATLDCQQLGTELQDNVEQSSSEYDSSLSTGSVSSSDSEVTCLPYPREAGSDLHREPHERQENMQTAFVLWKRGSGFDTHRRWRLGGYTASTAGIVGGHVTIP